MPKRGKNYQESLKIIDRTNLYDSKEAIELVQQTAKAKFDETIKLGVDPRHADQQVRGTVVLPHGTGKTKKVLVFAKGEKLKEADMAGHMGTWTAPVMTLFMTGSYQYAVDYLEGKTNGEKVDADAFKAALSKAF